LSDFSTPNILYRSNKQLQLNPSNTGNMHPSN
jgi:hypothetical protein